VRRVKEMRKTENIEVLMLVENMHVEEVLHRLKFSRNKKLKANIY